MQTEATANEKRLTLIYALTLGAIAVTYKVLPRYLVDPTESALWNLVPMGALALFVGSRLRTTQAYLIPLVAMVASDLLLIQPLAAQGFPSFTASTPLIYLSFLLYVVLGRWIPARSMAPVALAGGALAGSVQFFLLSNFASFLAFYPFTWAGLAECYTLAIPYYRSTLASDLLFTGLFFALHALLVFGVASKEAQVPA